MTVDGLGRAGAFVLRRLACVGAIAAVAATPALAEPFRALPVDDAGEVPELEALRDSLLEAVRQRDVEAVVALASPDIALSFGGHAGRDTLRSWLQGQDDQPWTGDLYWQELQEVLELGGAWWDYGSEAGRSFCAPYTFYAPLPDALDVFAAIIIIREAAPLRTGPGEDHPVIAELSYDIAELIPGDAGPPAGPSTPYWASIRTADGAHEGYVRSTDFRSPVDYRACFGQDAETGAWIWEAFIAGD